HGRPADHAHREPRPRHGDGAPLPRLGSEQDGHLGRPDDGPLAIVWGRALGWYAMSLVDILPYLPSGDSGGALMLHILKGLAAARKTNQDPATGLWRQVVDMGTRSDDYPETSGSGMFVYALRLAIRRGYIDAATYQPVADKGWTGLQGKI